MGLFFPKALQPGMPISTAGFAKALQKIAYALEYMAVDGGFITWSNLGVPTIHIDAAASRYDPPASPAMEEITVMTSWRLDKTNHKFQVKTRTVKVAEPSDESEWTDVTDANGGVLDEGALP
jgi:hypothetical protein